jgi:hypothetical protein
MAVQRETVGLATGGKPYQSTGVKNTPVDTPGPLPATLEQAGIDKNSIGRGRPTFDAYASIVEPFSKARSA